MEIIQALAAFFVFFAVASAVIQVLFSYSLQVIAEKNELPDFAAFIAWIPLLQIYPIIKVGGGNFKTFLLGGLGAFVGIAVIAGGSAAAGFGGVGIGLAAAVFAVVAVVYMARIAMGTAERRGLSKWIGLLTFVPLANLFMYPYAAFHDGFRPPNKLGVLLGLLLAFGPLPAQIAIFEQMSQQAQVVAETDIGNGTTFEQALTSLGTTMEIDAEAMSEMEQLLQQQQQLAGTSATPPAPEKAVFQAPTQHLTQVAPGPPLTAGIPRNGDSGFAVPTMPACAAGTSRRGGAPPQGTRQWCEKVGTDAGIKHGWMTEYHASSGNPSVAGEYRDGLQVGVWTRYYEDGTKRVQAEFEAGLQDGVLISWNPDGSKAYEKFFAGGAPASPE